MTSPLNSLHLFFTIRPSYKIKSLYSKNNSKKLLYYKNIPNLSTDKILWSRSAISNCLHQWKMIVQSLLKGQRVNILGVMGHNASLTVPTTHSTLSVQCPSARATGITEKHVRCKCIIKLPLQNQAVAELHCSCICYSLPIAIQL